MLTFSRKPLGIWLVSVFALGASLFTALVLPSTVYADFSGTWIDKSTIRIGTNPDFKGPVTESVKTTLGGVPVPVQAFKTSNGGMMVYFSSSANLDTVRTGTFHVVFGTGSDQTVNMTNTRASVAVVPTTPTTPTTNSEDAAVTPVCDVGALSFLMCPLIELTGSAIDTVGQIIDGMMTLNPLPLSGGDVFNAWSSVLNIANVLLAIAFLVVIFAQSTSLALSNYGVKRMLPRIIAAAILMNLSYYICAIAIDLSNLAGGGITELLKTTIKLGSATGSTGDAGGIGAILSNLVSFVIKGMFTLGIIAILLAFALVPTLLAVLAVLFTLAARHAIVILLVLVAPLAFAAWVLPNTEKYFKKWWDWFLQMLLLYPMVMAIFAASAIAANLVASGAQAPQTEGFVDSTTNTQAFQGLIALIIMALPLIALPALFKASSGVIGRINGLAGSNLQKYGGGQAHGAITNMRKRQVSALGARMAKNSIGEGRGRFARRVGQGAAWAGGYKYQRDKKHGEQDRSIQIAQDEAYANRLLNKDSNFAQSAAGIGGPDAVERVRASAIDSVMRRGNERKENTEKMQSAFARLSPFAAQAFADSVDENGVFSREALQRQIDTRRAEGQLNENDIQELQRVQNFGSVFATAAMSGAAGSLARSGFLETSHIRKAEAAIRAQTDLSSAEKEVALDRLADNINGAAKESGMAQHMRWGVVGGKLVQNGQDIDIGGVGRYITELKQEGKPVPTQLEAAYNAYQQADVQADPARKTAALTDLMTQFETHYQTSLGFQKLGSAANISRKAFTDGGTQAFQFTMENNDGFREDVILTAAGAKGQMNAQDRGVLMQQAKSYVEGRGGDWEAVVAEAKQKAGLFTGGSTPPRQGGSASGPTPSPSGGTPPPATPGGSLPRPQGELRVPRETQSTETPPSAEQPQQGDVPDGYDDGNDRS